MSQIKDVMMADSIMEMAELGRFDRSLSAFAFVYWSEQNERIYCLSHKHNLISKYRNTLLIQKCMPSMTYSKYRMIPNYAGRYDVEEMSLKIKLALELKATYTNTDLQRIRALGQVTPNNNALAYMNTWRDALVGAFDQDQLQLFLKTLEAHYIALKIENEPYEQLRTWVLGELQQIDYQILRAGMGKKTFWGFAAQSNEHQQWKYYADANECAIFELENRLRLEGRIISPMWSKTVRTAPGQAPFELKKPFLEALKKQLNLTYLDEYQHIWSSPSPVDTNEYQDLMGCLEGEESKRMLSIFGNHWGIVG